MYKLIQSTLAALFLMSVALILIWGGQWVEIIWPETAIPFAGLCICMSAGVILSIALTIYEKGWNAAKIDQKPDEVISRTGEEGVFLQPTGSHETDPFVK